MGDGFKMETVHIFISTGRFSSFDEMRRYIDATYTADGDAIPSRFIKEVGLFDYEPGCIEAIISDTEKPVSLVVLLKEASYSSQWLPNLAENSRATAAICVFSPNQLQQPQLCSLEYLGVFTYRPEK